MPFFVPLMENFAHFWKKGWGTGERCGEGDLRSFFCCLSQKIPVKILTSLRED
jgi:hypothetical protein